MESDHLDKKLDLEGKSKEVCTILQLKATLK